MRSRRFSVYDAPTGPVVMDDGGRIWATVPRGVADPAACAEAVLDIARKVYALGLADAYSGNRRSFAVRKGGDGEDARRWDLVTVSKETRRIGSLPRRGFRPWPDPARALLEGIGPELHAAALSDGRQGAGEAASFLA